MPRWKRNLIIAAVIALFIYIPVTLSHLLGYIWHFLFTRLDAVKHDNHWH